MNFNEAIDSIVKQLKNYIGEKRAVIGLSGGIDSSVVAYFLVKALDKGNIFSVVLPYGDQDSSDGELIASQLGINCTKVNIKPIVDKFPCQSDRLTKGNIMARVRMTILYAYTNIASSGGIVVGTTNKTEAEVNYYTKYGDGGVDIEPIADLYKTEIWEVGKILGVPQKIIDKTPSAGLWEGQTDEDELGMTYQEIDDILETLKLHSFISLITAKFNRYHIKIKELEQKYGPEKIDRVENLIINSEHKKCMPPIFRVR